jgi:hypothetical protein
MTWRAISARPYLVEQVDGNDVLRLSLEFLGDVILDKVGPVVVVFDLAVRCVLPQQRGLNRQPGAYTRPLFGLS